MPIYEYQCSACGHNMEAIQKISDALLTACPSCQQETLEKCVTAPSFRLGGSGWYETDFKSGNKKNLSTSDEKKTDKKEPSKKKEPAKKSASSSTESCKQ